MGPVALDADVAIGFLDPRDAHHDRAVAKLRELRRRPLVLPAAAYSETLVKPLADGTADLVEEFIDAFDVVVVAADRAVARRAAELRARHQGLRLPDALTLATAQLQQAELVTFDARLARISGR
jgi:predicted nucleic acid-binding protein